MAHQKILHQREPEKRNRLIVLQLNEEKGQTVHPQLHQGDYCMSTRFGWFEAVTLHTLLSSPDYDLAHE